MSAFGSMRRWVPVIGAALACWSTALFVHEHWFGFDEALETTIVLAAAWFGWLRLRRGEPSGGSSDGIGRRAAAGPSALWLVLGSSAFLAFVTSSHLVPRLVGHAMLVFGATATLVAVLDAPARRRAWALMALTLLALPVVPSLQYVVGFPLRLASAFVASFWLGPNIEAIGTGLTDGVNTVFVDGPCSGIRMLWTSSFLAASCALFARLTLCRTIVLLASAVGLAVLGNAIRTMALFVLEARIGTSQGHDAVGIVVFVSVAAAVVWLGRTLAGGSSAKEAQSVAPPAPTRRPALRSIALGVHLLAAIAAAITPLVRGGGERVDRTTAAVVRSAPDWPSTWGGDPLMPVAASATLGRFAERFPGTCAEFYLGGTERRILFRWTPVPTRHLHEAATCFRGMGARIEPRPPRRDAAGHRWTRFFATFADGRRLAVRQCYFQLTPGETGVPLELAIRRATSWPDASSWYWSTAKPGAARGDTVAITVSEWIDGPVHYAAR